MELLTMAKNKRLFTVVPRLIVLVTTAIAAIIMAASHERANLLFISFDANYSRIPALKYFVIVNAVVSVYSLLVLFLPAESLLWRFVLGMDVVMSMLLMSSLSASLAIAFLGKNGDYNAGWLPICGQVQNFCRQVEAALITGFIGLIMYLLLVLYAIQTSLSPPHK